eukprot:1827772-Alexandrium_andersonii.AAC.1
MRRWIGREGEAQCRAPSLRASLLLCAPLQFALQRVSGASSLMGCSLHASVDGCHVLQVHPFEWT